MDLSNWGKDLSEQQATEIKTEFNAEKLLATRDARVSLYKEMIAHYDGFYAAGTNCIYTRERFERDSKIPGRVANDFAGADIGDLNYILLAEGGYYVFKSIEDLVDFTDARIIAQHAEVK